MYDGDSTPPDFVATGERIRVKIEDLFSKYHTTDLPRDIGAVADYFSHVADAIDYDRLEIRSNRVLLGYFDTVMLWLRDSLLAYPDSIGEQVFSLAQEKQLPEVIGLFANLSERHLSYIRRRAIYGRLPALLYMFSRFAIVPGNDSEYVTSPKLLDAKMGLKRLSQILRYAASMEVVEYDETFQAFRQHYDPNLVNKSKVLSLIHLLRVQVEATPDEAHQKLILSKLESIEAELKKSKVRWSAVFTGLIVILGFLADLKSVAPNVYDKSVQTVEAILHVLKTDGMVQNSRGDLLLDHKDSSDRKPTDGIPDNNAILTEPVRPKDDDEQDEE
ncbi:hypothetical protein [Lacipirellula sp.]|uniref:hypothetical protein n=1 Tax=Lacipirellula sp. TaxID=2691419 RepID=UPI003D0ECFE9